MLRPVGGFPIESDVFTIIRKIFNLVDSVDFRELFVDISVRFLVEFDKT